MRKKKHKNMVRVAYLGSIPRRPCVMRGCQPTKELAFKGEKDKSIEPFIFQDYLVSFEFYEFSIRP